MAVKTKKKLARYLENLGVQDAGKYNILYGNPVIEVVKHKAHITKTILYRITVPKGERLAKLSQEDFIIILYIRDGIVPFLFQIPYFTLTKYPYIAIRLNTFLDASKDPHWLWGYQLTPKNLTEAQLTKQAEILKTIKAKWKIGHTGRKSSVKITGPSIRIPKEIEKIVRSKIC